jgi:peptidoglycan/xylan/chitin deacetylase (PgdA/CDA1 family)
LEFLYKSFARTGGDRLVWSLDASRLRILCYHGICEDRLAAEPWMPQYFVTSSVFESQLQYLQRAAHVMPLGEAVKRLYAGTLPPRSVCLTFDDGYANNLHLALPLLRKYRIPATIFLSTSYVESGDMYPFLKLKFVREAAGEPVADYKSAPMDELLRRSAPWWPAACLRLTDQQRQTLRSMTIDEVRSCDMDLIEFGGHTHTHCILKNETPARRSEEIRTCLAKIREWTGRPSRLFSYPNGEVGDFDEGDKAVLRDEGIEVAVTGVPGANGSRSESLALRRYPIGLFHDKYGFRAEVTGFRSTVKLVSRSLGR